MKYRFENFGGIVASENRPFLAMVDRDFMRGLGLGPSPAWETPDETIGTLSAPTEAHFAITNRCPNGCRHCYMASGEPEPDELDTDSFKKALKTLADFGVFHVALGGGEALTRSDLFDIAGFTRSLGLVPNLTTSGALLSSHVAERMRVFGRVNVSTDFPDDNRDDLRQTSVRAAGEALSMLIGAGIPAGINCVVSRSSFPGIPGLFRYAAEKGVQEIEFLRLKPAGRGRTVFDAEQTSYDQNVRLLPLLTECSEKYGVKAKIDCSFVPMLCEHNPPPELLAKTATYGCVAGNVLVGIRSNGMVSGCSFLQSIRVSVFDLPAKWNDCAGLQVYRDWAFQAPDPCRSCKYLTICKGGCHAVAARSKATA